MIRVKIAFVLRMVDDYSGQCIRKNRFLFTIGERVVHPVEKEEGLYVFLELQEAVTRVRLEGPGYHPCTVRIEKKDLDPEEPVADVRLYRKPGVPGSCEYRIGRMPEGTPFPAAVWVRRSRPTGLSFREYRKIGKEHWFLFQGFPKENLIGKTCVIENKEKLFPFVIMEKRGINEYRVEPEEEPPENLGSGDPLVRIYRSVTDSGGSYAIPVEPGEEESQETVMLW